MCVLAGLCWATFWSLAARYATMPSVDSPMHRRFQRSSYTVCHWVGELSMAAAAATVLGPGAEGLSCLSVMNVWRSWCSVTKGVGALSLLCHSSDNVKSCVKWKT